MNRSEREHQINLPDVAPSSWFTTKEGSSLWISGYHAWRVEKDELLGGPKVFDLNQIRGVMLYGKLRYPRPLSLEVASQSQLHLTVPDLFFAETKEGSYLLLLTPLDIDGRRGDETAVRERLGASVGLLAAFSGRNLVFEHVCDFTFNLHDGSVTSSGQSAENPFHFAPPDVSQTKLSAVSEADKAIAALPEADENRVRLSLRWFESALYADGVDAYLKYWLAIETLGMPNTTDIRPLVESLSRSYGLSYVEARQRFSVGRLFGLRSRIVHDGQIVYAHQSLSKYIEALYVDLLFEHLGLSSERRAGAIITDPNFDLKQYLHET
jgi:hypothetical protein